MSDLSRLSFEEVAARAPKHDPAACTRPGCRRCAGPHDASPPKVGRNPHDAAKRNHREPSPWDALVQPLRTVAASMPDLSKSMLTLAEAITVHGDDRWQRLLAWEKHQLSVSLVREEPDEETDEDGRTLRQVSARTQEDRDDDRRASRYANDARQATRRLLDTLAAPTEHTLSTDVQAVRYLIAIAELRRPRTLKSREVLASQAATDGWCRSCFRVGVFEPIGLQPDGTPRWRDLCRWCGRNKGDSPQPPVDMVRVHHRLPDTGKAAWST